MINKTGLYLIASLYICSCMLYAQDTIVMPATGNGGFYNTCYAVILDNGADSNYHNSSHSIITISPLWVENITLYFESFDTEIYFDSLTIYDGPGISFPKIGTYSGNQLQGQAIQSTGNAVTLEFATDDIVTGTGFKAWISCTVGTEEENTDNIQMYPNPANTFMQIKEIDFSTIDKLFITDASGRIIKILPVNSIIDIHELDVGLYILCMEIKNRKILQKKFIKN